MRIEQEYTAAIVVDYQEKLVPVMSDKEQLIHNSEILLKGLKILEVPMYITQRDLEQVSRRLQMQWKMWPTRTSCHSRLMTVWPIRFLLRNILSYVESRPISVYFRR